MKHTLFFFFLLACLGTTAQTIDHIKFDYDTSGNQVKRYSVDIILGRYADSDVTEISEINEHSLIEVEDSQHLKYYPNPVKDQLYLSWTNLPGRYADRIDIYNLNGQLLQGRKGLREANDTTLDFQSLPRGYYNLLVSYSDGTQKTVKIVKD